MNIQSAATELAPQQGGFGVCFLYLAVVGAVSFLIGRILPKSWFCAGRFPFRSFRCEQEGRIYLGIQIKKWQKKVPDMSRLFRRLMPPKKLTKETLEALPLLIQETCVAELTHWLLAFVGFYCVRLWRGWGGLVMSILFFLGNIPFILIQRYNRPRLQRLLCRQQGSSPLAGDWEYEEGEV